MPKNSSPSPTVTPMNPRIYSPNPNHLLLAPGGGGIGIGGGGMLEDLSGDLPVSFSSLLMPDTGEPPLDVDEDDEDEEALVVAPNPNPSPLASALPFIDPTPHVSSQFYTFTSAAHELMLRCLLEGRIATPDEIRAAVPAAVLASWRAVWKDRNHETAYLTAWKRIQDKLSASPTDATDAATGCGGYVLFKSSSRAQRVSHVDQWHHIVSSGHVDPDSLCHLGLKETIDRIKQLWTVGAKFYGIPESFIRVCVASCPVCSGSHPSRDTMSPGHLKRRRRFEYTETLDVPARDVPRRLQQLAAKHKVVLCIRQKYIRYKPFMAEVKDYACHRAGLPTSVAAAGIPSSKKIRTPKREPYQSKRCGCGFRIRAIVPISNYNEKDRTFIYEEEGTAVFKLYAVHSGHEPGPLDGSARIVHRLVGHKDPVEFDPDIYGVEEESDLGYIGKDYVDDVHNIVMQRVRELKAEVGSLEAKISKMPMAALPPLSTELLEVLHRIRKINIDGSVLGESLLCSNEDSGPWAAGTSHCVDRHGSGFCKEAEGIDAVEDDFDTSLGPIVSWERLEDECEDRKMLIGESPKCDKWMIKVDGGDFDENRILNCVEDDYEQNSKLMKPMSHEESIVTDPALGGIHIDGFYSSTKWYDSPGDTGDMGFRHGGLV